MAEFGIELNRSGADSSYTNGISLNYSLDSFMDNETEKVGLGHSWNYTFTNTQSIQNLNTNLPDFTIKNMGHDFSYDLVFLEALTLSLGYSYESFNDNEAVRTGYTTGLYYQLGDFQIGYLATNADTVQKKQVIVLQDLTDQIRFNQKSSTYYLSARWVQSFATSLSYTTYTYDKNLDNFYTILTTVAVLNRSGPSVASEVASQLKKSTDLNFSYNLSESWLINLGVGVSEDYLAPSSKTNNATMGVEYELESNDVYYRVFASANASKPSDDNQASLTGSFGVGVSF